MAVAVRHQPTISGPPIRSVERIPSIDAATYRCRRKHIDPTFHCTFRVLPSRIRYRSKRDRSLNSYRYTKALIRNIQRHPIHPGLSSPHLDQIHCSERSLYRCTEGFSSTRPRYRSSQSSTPCASSGRYSVTSCGLSSTIWRLFSSGVPSMAKSGFCAFSNEKVKSQRPLTIRTGFFMRGAKSDQGFKSERRFHLSEKPVSCLIETRQAIPECLIYDQQSAYVQTGFAGACSGRSKWHTCNRGWQLPPTQSPWHISIIPNDGNRDPHPV